MTLTETQRVILEALARFKYLTSQQLQLIMNLQTTSSINTAIRGLKVQKYPLIKSISFGIVPGKGKLSNIHCLTGPGVRLLINEAGFKPEVMLHPKSRNPFFQRDYFHRISVITFNIRFQKWVSGNRYQYIFFHSYFNRSQEFHGRKSQTALHVGNQWVEPDGIGLFKISDEKYLFIFEQHNGKDKRRAIKQMINHCIGLAAGTVSDLYGLNKPAKIVYVFEHHSCLLAVMGEFMKHPGLSRFKDYFLFKSEKELSFSFFKYWHSPSGHFTDFIPTANGLDRP